MRNRHLYVASALLLAVMFVAGCAMFNKTKIAYTRTTTLGQELIDLQAAKEKGAITEAEYQELKEQIKQGEGMTMPCGGEKKQRK